MSNFVNLMLKYALRKQKSKVKRKLFPKLCSLDSTVVKFFLWNDWIVLKDLNLLMFHTAVCFFLLFGCFITHVAERSYHLLPKKYVCDFGKLLGAVISVCLSMWIDTYAGYVAEDLFSSLCI